MGIGCLYVCLCFIPFACVRICVSVCYWFVLFLFFINDVFVLD